MVGWKGLLLAATVLGTAGDGFAQTPAPVPQVAVDVGALLATADLPGARLGVVVMDAATGLVIYQHQGDVALNPASNAKVLTAAAALSILGPSRRFTTTLYGRYREGIVQGPLVLRGQGDPSLRTADLYVLARDLAALGIRRVDGGIAVDDGYYGSQHLPPAFDQQPRETAAFRAAVGAVSVDDNTITLHVRPGPSPGRLAGVNAEPDGYVDVESDLVTAAGGVPVVSVELTPTAGGRERARVTGRFPVTMRSATYARRLENPGIAAGWALRAALGAVGIAVAGGVSTEAPRLDGLAVLATHQSAPLSSLLYEVGKESNNFYAEMILLAIAAEPTSGARPAEVTFQRGADRVVDWARRAGISTQGLVVRNGSGLYDANRVTALAVVQILRAAWRDPAIRDEYVSQLAVGGDDGTLRNRLHLTGAERWVRAKTGTLDDVIALSGFVLSPDPARTLLFSFLGNGVRGRGAQARALADQLVTTLVHVQSGSR